MLLKGSTALDTFAQKRPTARKRFAQWFQTVRDANWKHLVDLKRTYQQTDGGVKGIYTIFNLGSFRVVARVNFEASFVEINHVFTHDEYMYWTKTK